MCYIMMIIMPWKVVKVHVENGGLAALNDMCDQATGINNFLMPSSWGMLYGDDDNDYRKSL